METLTTIVALIAMIPFVILLVGAPALVITLVTLLAVGTLDDQKRPGTLDEAPIAPPLIEPTPA